MKQFIDVSMPCIDSFAEEFVVTHKGVSTLVNTVSLLQQDRQTIQTNKKNKQEAYKQFMVNNLIYIIFVLTF